jgi:hypothetical protein
MKRTSRRLSPGYGSVSSQSASCGYRESVYRSPHFATQNHSNAFRYNNPYQVNRFWRTPNRLKMAFVKTSRKGIEKFC